MVCIPTDAEIPAFTYHHPDVSKQERRHGFDHLSRFPACHAFPPAYRIQIVGFVCYSNGAHMQISVFGFFGTSAAVRVLIAIGRVCHVFDGRRQSLSSLSRRSMIMICAVAQRVWRTMFKTMIAGTAHHQKMGVFLRVSTILRLRDHPCAQDQIFRRRAAKVAN